jgi:hypothetical protein
MTRQAEHEHEKEPTEKAPGVGIEMNTTRGRRETAAPVLDGGEKVLLVKGQAVRDSAPSRTSANGSSMCRSRYV